METTENETMSVGKARKKIGLCYAVTLKLAKSGELPCIRLGKRFLIHESPWRKCSRERLGMKPINEKGPRVNPHEPLSI